MAGIPPHREPQTEVEREIAQAMTQAARFFDDVRRRFPDLPPTAISTGLINYGTQLGCKHADPVTVAAYLMGVAHKISPAH